MSKEIEIPILNSMDTFNYWNGTSSTTDLRWCSRHSYNCNCYQPSTWTYWTTSTPVYMYQLTCPKCKKMNWCEMNKTVKCKCGSTLKAVAAKDTDYEIPVSG